MPAGASPHHVIRRVRPLRVYIINSDSRSLMHAIFCDFPACGRTHLGLQDDQRASENGRWMARVGSIFL